MNWPWLTAPQGLSVRLQRAITQVTAELAEGATSTSPTQLRLAGTKWVVFGAERNHRLVGPNQPLSGSRSPSPQA